MKLTSMPLESDAFNSNTPLEYAEPRSCLASAWTLVVWAMGVGKKR
jgi:hypothetical protein